MSKVKFLRWTYIVALVVVVVVGGAGTFYRIKESLSIAGIWLVKFGHYVHDYVISVIFV